MELNKNYPWLKGLEISNQIAQDWQDKKINKKSYFLGFKE